MEPRLLLIAMSIHKHWDSTLELADHFFCEKSGKNVSLQDQIYERDETIVYSLVFIDVRIGDILRRSRDGVDYEFRRECYVDTTR